jgi:hypothetical protein
MVIFCDIESRAERRLRAQEGLHLTVLVSMSDINVDDARPAGAEGTSQILQAFPCVLRKDGTVSSESGGDG